MDKRGVLVKKLSHKKKNDAPCVYLYNGKKGHSCHNYMKQRCIIGHRSLITQEGFLFNYQCSEKGE